MKKLLIISCTIILLITFVGCNESVSTEILPSNQGSYTDERDSTSYNWVRLGDKEWMCDNLRFDTKSKGCKVYDFPMYDPNRTKEKNFEKYGFLYTVEDALKAIPEGWRLPSDEDWLALESLFEDANWQDTGWRGSIAGKELRRENGGCKMQLKSGGMIEARGTKQYYLEMYGYFWTSNKKLVNDFETQIFRKVGYVNDGIFRASTNPLRYMSVRCVRDAK